MSNRTTQGSGKIKSCRFKILFWIFIFLSNYLSGQDCTETLNQSCSFGQGKDYKQFIITRAAYVEIDTPSLCSVVLPPNKDYLIKFCSEAKGKPLKIKFYNKETNQLIYDNSNENYAESTTLSVGDHPFYIRIEIIVSSLTASRKDMNKDDSGITRACAGFWIYFKKQSEE